MRKYFNGKKHINSLADAIGYETDMVEISLLKKEYPEKAGEYVHIGFFEYENEKYSLDLNITYSLDDIGKIYLDTVEFNFCTKIEE
jgi:DNA polymerase III sliding clamp (beta) subunit (PCNA family)